MSKCFRTLRKNNLAEGTLIAYFAILFTKILGALYAIPFYAIVGEEGGVLYSYSYTIYNLFLSISTAGIPVAVSKMVAEKVANNTIFVRFIYHFLVNIGLKELHLLRA